MSRSLTRLWLAVASLVAGAVIGLGPRSSIGAVVAAIIGAFLLTVRRRPVLLIFGVALVAGGLGMVAASARTDEGREVATMASDVPRCTFTGRVLEQAGGLGTLASVNLGCDGWTPASGTVILNEGERADAGAAISGVGWLLPLGDDAFARARMRLGARALLDPIEVKVSPPTTLPLIAAAGLRGGVRSAASALPSAEGGLLLGITIGDTSKLSAGSLELFRRAGLAHLLAVSGSNVAIVLGAAALLTRRLGYRVRLVVAGLSLGMFVLVVGPDASVLRASCMGAVGLAALGWVRRVDPLHTLALALLVIVGTRPAMIYSAGLHLSLAATIGIVLWARVLARRLAPLPTTVAVVPAVTLSAQVAVAPVLIATFGELSLAAPLANVLVAPVIAIATVFGMAAGLFQLVVPGIGALLVRLCDPLLDWVLFVGDWLGSPAWAAVELPRWWSLPLGLVVVALAARTLLREPDVAGRP